jgi:diacylglycerol kinase (ATP)
MMIAVAVILNGISRQKKVFCSEIQPALQKKFAVTVFETCYDRHARDLAREACSGNFAVIVAAGGDGTLHHVVNGMLQSGAPQLPSLGLFPLGSGNDFARTCMLKPDVDHLIRLVETAKPLATDIGRLICRSDSGGENTEFFINECSLGMGPDVVRRLIASNRKLGPFLTYHSAIIRTFLGLSAQTITCKSSSWEKSGKMRVIAIANGKCFGHGLYISPDAIPDDGTLNVFVASDVPLWRFLLYLHALKRNRKLNNDYTYYGVSTGVELNSEEICPIETDGELAGYLPARIDILPGRINFLR